MTGGKDNELDKLQSLADEADAELRDSEGGGQSPDSVAPGETENQEGHEEAKPAIDPDDAREIAEFMCEGLAGVVHEFIPVLDYPKDTIDKATTLTTPLVEKYAPMLVSGDDKKISLIKIIRDYKAEGKAAWFFVKLTRESLAVMRQAREQAVQKMKEANQVKDGEMKETQPVTTMFAYGDDKESVK